MLRITQQVHAAAAKAYYSSADYYADGVQTQGVWRGLAAERLGLDGPVDAQAWDALCDNLDPTTGQRLTVRQKSNRRVGWDFNFNVPKSLSLVAALTEAPELREAFAATVDEVMKTMEAQAQTRVSVGHAKSLRTTGNLVWGRYLHDESRPVAGEVDPNLHAHCFVLNATFDAVEGKWKAAELSALKRDAPYFEALFHNRLAQRVQELGYAIERTQDRWEIVGLPKPLLAKFSRRTREIEAKAAALGIADPELKDRLGAKTRAKKAAPVPPAELKAGWLARLTRAERESLRQVSARQFASPPPPDILAASVAHSLQHTFERASVAPVAQLKALALRHGVGHLDPQQLDAELARQGLITRSVQGRLLGTTREVLLEEQRLLQFARRGRGASRALAPNGAIQEPKLSDQQRRAVEHLWTTPDRVLLLRGAAGVGKTTLLKEAVRGIEAGGTRVFAFAPSADASRGTLRAEGFGEADTVARFLLDEELQRQAAGQLLLIDEAGLLGTRQMAELFRVAERLDARLLLSGDWRQHAAVERGAALRLLETEAGLVPAEVKAIVRQTGAYRAAVEALAVGDTDLGLKRLDALGWIVEEGDGTRSERLARDYADARERGESVLVVSPTHAEGDQVTQALRAELRARGQLGTAEQEVLALRNRHLTEAERKERQNYAAGDVLEFHGRGRRAGERLTVHAEAPPPVAEAERFSVYRPGEVTLAAGDLVRITRNGKTVDGQHRLNNGAVFRVAGFSKAGDLRLANGWLVGRDFGHLDYGYVSTSHAAQGKTVDRVLIALSSASHAAASREQLYVSTSRGRRQAVLYTDDREGLAEAVRRTEVKLAATELVNGPLPAGELPRRRRQRQEIARRSLLPPVPEFHLQREASSPPKELEHGR